MLARATRSHVQARSSRLIGRTVTVDHDGSCPAQFGTVNGYALREDQPAGRAPGPAGEDARARAEPPADRLRVRPPVWPASPGRLAARMWLEPDRGGGANQHLERKS